MLRVVQFHSSRPIVGGNMKVEYYTLKPSLKQYFGRKVNKSLTFDEWTEDKKVHQTLKDLELVTEIHDERKMKMVAQTSSFSCHLGFFKYLLIFLL